jgi:hypothetical protein
MRLLFGVILAALALVGAAPSSAGENVTVVELYTSQGCSSCPPVDALLEKLAKRDDVIALALHVDYWDYIGWADIFADPKFTQRQRSYARAAGHRSIFTPQLIIGGTSHIVGNKPMEIADAISEHNGRAVNVDLQVTRDGNRVDMSATWVGLEKFRGRMVVQLVQYEPQKSVKITRGENAGNTINYANIVTLWKPVGTWDGRATKRFRFEVADDDQPLAIILQQDNSGPIIAATKLD